MVSRARMEPLAPLARRGLLVRLALPESLPIRLQLTAALWGMKKRGLRLWLALVGRKAREVPQASRVNKAPPVRMVQREYRARKGRRVFPARMERLAPGEFRENQVLQGLRGRQERHLLRVSIIIRRPIGARW